MDFAHESFVTGKTLEYSYKLITIIFHRKKEIFVIPPKYPADSQSGFSVLKLQITGICSLVLKGDPNISGLYPLPFRRLPLLSGVSLFGRI